MVESDGFVSDQYFITNFEVGLFMFLVKSLFVFIVSNPHVTNSLDILNNSIVARNSQVDVGRQDSLTAKHK